MTWATVVAAGAVHAAAEWTDPAVVVPALGALVVAVATAIIGPVWVRRMAKTVDDAAARKATAETVSIEVATARSLIQEVKAMMADQRTHYEGKLSTLSADHQAQLKSLSERVSSTEEQQRGMRAALASHSLWDDAAVAALREIHPMFPDPPPVCLPED